MFGILLYDVLFFSIPAVFLVLFGLSLYRYLYARKKNKTASGTFSDSELKKRKIMLIIFSVPAAILVMIALGLCVLSYLAVAYM